MSFTLNSVSSTVAVTGNVQTGRPAGSTLVKKDYQNSAAGTADLYTVTAGKTLYITHAWVSCSSGQIASNYQECAIQVDNDSGTYVKIVAAASGQAAAQGNGNGVAVAFFTPVEVAATKKVQIYKNGTGSGNYMGGFWGYEL